MLVPLAFEVKAIVAWPMIHLVPSAPTAAP